MTFRNTLSKMWTNVQYSLFPSLENDLGELSDDLKTLVAVLELVRIEEFLISSNWVLGRIPRDRAAIARAFIAKIVLKIPYTNQLISYIKGNKQLKVICGWEPHGRIPSESKFSRAFKEFADSSLPERVHQVLISGIYKGKIIGHLVRDSTPIVAREKALKKEGTYEERKKQANEKYLKEKKGELVSRRQKQLIQSLEESIKELPTDCDIGSKKGSQGFRICWKGYKFHIATDDHAIPISAILTSASLNDCEAAIPLANKANKLVKNFYDLMDSAYDVSEIKEHSLSLGHVPIIDKHARSTDQKKEKGNEYLAKKTLNAFTPEDKRYRERFSKERCNSLLKDFYGGRNIFYKGHSKIFCHLMFGILALTASTLLTLSQ